ncbi:MAG TPA: penicillin-binding protein 2 [Gemmatimonadaceae bacterium]|nr:penicillin-binding protein 2 [Gemmatimonadaceae bacterium]
MSFHPNDIARRTRLSGVLLSVAYVFLLGAFFKTQVLQHQSFDAQSEENRLRPIPLPAPRGIIYDRKGEIIAENLPAYSVSVIAPREDSLRATLKTLQPTLQLTDNDISQAIRRFRRAPTRPTVVLPDASIDVISVLEEHRIDYPRLIIQSVPKRYYPDGPIVASFVGYTGEISEDELNKPQYAGYKPGQTIGKGGLEKQYENVLHGEEGERYDEVDARGRPVRGVGPRPVREPKGAPALKTNIDMDLQKFVASLWGDSLQGGAIALDPKTGAVLALYSHPSFDPNRFTGGIPADYWKELNTDPRRPLFNKVIQGTYPPGSTWKLATSTLGLEQGLVSLDTRMPISCSGGLQYGRRYFRCWEKRGHGSQTLAGAITHSCDVYFYQLGLKIGLSKLVAGGVDLQFKEKSGIDLPNEIKPRFPAKDVKAYYDRLFGARNWSNAETLNLAIGQGANSQTVANMAKFYTALATDGSASKPEVVTRNPERTKIFSLTSVQMDGLRKAMAGVTSAGGTAASANIQGLTLAGKTGSAQNTENPNKDHAWFVGFAPGEDPKIVVAVFLEFGIHGYYAARVASKIVGHYLHITPVEAIDTGG